MLWYALWNGLPCMVHYCAVVGGLCQPGIGWQVVAAGLGVAGVHVLGLLPFVAGLVLGA